MNTEFYSLRMKLEFVFFFFIRRRSDFSLTFRIVFRSQLSRSFRKICCRQKKRICLKKHEANIIYSSKHSTYASDIISHILFDANKCTESCWQKFCGDPYDELYVKKLKVISHTCTHSRFRIRSQDFCLLLTTSLLLLWSASTYGCCCLFTSYAVVCRAWTKQARKSISWNPIMGIKKCKQSKQIKCFTLNACYALFLLFVCLLLNRGYGLFALNIWSTFFFSDMCSWCTIMTRKRWEKNEKNILSFETSRDSVA